MATASCCLSWSVSQQVRGGCMNLPPLGRPSRTLSVAPSRCTRRAAVVAKTGAQSEQFAAACFFRCIGLVERAEQVSTACACQERWAALQRARQPVYLFCPSLQAATSGAFDPDEAAEFVVCALDLIRCAQGCYGWREGIAGVKASLAIHRPIACSPLSPLCSCSGMTEGLGVSIESLVGRSPLRDIIVRSCKVPR